MQLSRVFYVTVTALIASNVFSGCTTSALPPTATAPEDNPGWSYSGTTGPADWGSLSPTYALCSSEQQQSPIDLAAPLTPATDPISTAYSDGVEEFVNDGHTIVLNTGPGSAMLRNNTEYFLLEMHFHAPSEHTFDGKNFPVEFHFIHKDNDENILAIGVMGIAGNTNNEAWEPFVAAATQDGSVSENIELSALLPQSTEHYAYEGSLTTPPCSEGVEWIVLTTPVELSAEQIATLTAAYSNNSRPLQLRNGRPITKTSP